MNGETFDHIREDVRNAMVENRNDDPGLMPELVMFLLGVLGDSATRTCNCGPLNPESYDGPQRNCPSHGDWPWITAGYLERCQLRALSKIPFAEADACDQADAPYDPDWRDHA